MTTLYDKIIAAIGLMLFAVFLGIIFWKVAEWDLRLVLILAVVMATYDFWRDAFRPGPKGRMAPTQQASQPHDQHDGI